MSNSKIHVINPSWNEQIRNNVNINFKFFITGSSQDYKMADNKGVARIFFVSTDNLNLTTLFLATPNKDGRGVKWKFFKKESNL